MHAFKHIFLLLIFFISGSVNADCLRYGDIITLFFGGSNDRFLVAEKNGHANANRTNAAQWEKFLVLNESGKANWQKVLYGNKISLLSYHDKFLVAEPNGEVNANRNALGPWEKWEIVRFNGAPPNNPNNNCIFLSAPSQQGIVALKSYHGKYLQPDSGGGAKATLSNIDTSPMPNNSTYIAIHKRAWTDFYYNRHFPSMSGSCDRCPYRGKFDGANCFIAKAPGNPAFIHQNNFYYGGNSCILGNHDNANCMVGSNPGSAQPFIIGNNFYLKNSCP